MNDTYDEQKDAIFRQQISVLSLQDVLKMLEGEQFENRIVDVSQHPIGLDNTMLSTPKVIVSTNTHMSPPLTYVMYKDLCGNTTGNRIEFVNGEYIHYKFDGITEADEEDTDDIEIPGDMFTGMRI